MDRYERMIKEAKSQQKTLDSYLDVLKKRSKEYLIGYIEGMIMSGRIKIEEDLK